jgi:hypothetical protein
MSTDLDVEVESTANWIPADKGYELAIEGKKLICKNPKGNQLASLPKWLRESELAGEMKGVVDWLVEHNRECESTIETWMLRSLAVPRSVLVSVWEDPSWSDALGNLVVCPLDKKDNPVQEQSGFLRDVDAKKGVGIVDLDGETQWLKVDRVMIPHPILLAELDDFRELATELSFNQVIDQLFRETWASDPDKPDAESISEFSNGKFEALSHAVSLCRRLGYRVRGGSAACPVWENGTLTEARFWVGADDPEWETHTGELIFTDAMEKSVPIGKVGPVAYSEGMRMASGIYAKRVVKTDDDED